MHAHHKNLLRDFWLISPGKTPTGKTSQRGEILIIFFSNVQDRKIVEKNNLSPPANFFTKSGKIMLSKTANTLFSFLCQTSSIRPYCFLGIEPQSVQHQQAVHSLDFCAIYQQTVQH